MKGLGNEVAPAPSALSPLVIQRLVENQARDLALRGEEVRLRTREVEAGHRYAEKALEAQARDRTEAREATRAARRDQMAFAAFLIAVFVASVGGLIATGHKDFAMEVLKAAVFVFSGGAGGYFLARNRVAAGEGETKG